MRDVRIEDLKQTDRLMKLHAQAIAQGRITPSESDRLKFVAAAEHALAVGTKNPCGLFASLVRHQWWRMATQDDEDAASTRLKRHLHGHPLGFPGLAAKRPEPAPPAPTLSADAVLVGQIRQAVKSAGCAGDPFYVLRKDNAAWTRPRWDQAIAELARAGRWG